MILNNYVIKSISKCFLQVQCIVLIVYLAIDFIERIDNFIEAELPVSIIILFFSYKIPFIFVQTTPIGFLLATILIFGFMKKNNELMVLQSSGINLKILLKSVFILGIIGSFGIFIISEIVVPFLSIKTNKIWFNDVKKEPIHLHENDIWIKEVDKIIHINKYLPEQKKMIEVTVNYFDDNFELVRRMDAKIGFLYVNKCILYDVIEQKMNKSNDSYDVLFHDRFDMLIEIDIFKANKNNKISSEMNIIELYYYAKNTEAEGYNAKKYWVNYYNKIATYFVTLVFIMLGAEISLSNKASRGIPFNIFYGISLIFIYWVFHNFCISLGYADVVIPIISAWVVNLVFFCFVSIKLLRID